MELESKIEGLLFYKGEGLTVWKLAQLLQVDPNLIDEALIKLEKSLIGRGIVLVRKDDAVQLGITPELSDTIMTIRKDEVSRELSKASLETLTIVVYKNGITRSEIDYIRGVNSSFILRNLLVRGLVEKVYDEKDNRRVLYRPTFETLSFMGITSIDQLPEYINIQNQLNTVIANTTSNNE